MKKEMTGKIGLELHLYPVTKEKLFCTCVASREKGLRENTNVCPVCTGQPGAKPMLPNVEAVKKAVAIGLMLGCKINKKMNWQRKHYDWPDLPKGYQNTLSGAYAVPVGEKGKFSGISIWSMHLEEDPASWNPETGEVDYNRSGLPLIEIVTAPDFSTSEEVVAWLKKLILSLGYLKAIDKNAGVKADVNVNLENVTFSSPKILKKQLKISGLIGEKGKTERVEIKNISSIEDIGRAIEYELERQMKEGSVRETRRFDSAKGKTERMRGKEEQDDYRFISDPDLQDIRIDEKFVKEIAKGLPESPEEKLKRFVKTHGIGKEDAGILAKNIDVAEFFEKVIELGKKRKVDIDYAKRWVLVELLRHLNYNKKTLDEIEIRVEDFVKLLELMKSGKITELQGKQILNIWKEKSANPETGLKGKGKISDVGELKKVIERVLKNNEKSVEDYKNGGGKAFNYLMGQVMIATEKRADFVVAGKILKRLLED